MQKATSPSALPGFLAEVVSETLGRSPRVDPVAPSTGGPAGNARLTAWTGLVLLALSVAEVVTLIDLGRLISWHVVIGVLLVPPALLKTASTSWRIFCYYRGRPTYAAAGPPPMALRVLGPAVVLFTMALLGSGLLLLALGPDSSRETLLRPPGVRINAITIHQVMFAAWAVVTGLHVIGRLVPALRLTVTRPERSRAVPGGRRRAVAIVLVVVIAAASGRLSLLAVGDWRTAVTHSPDRPSQIPDHPSLIPNDPSVIPDRPSLFPDDPPVAFGRGTLLRHNLTPRR